MRSGGTPPRSVSTRGTTGATTAGVTAAGVTLRTSGVRFTVSLATARNPPVTVMGRTSERYPSARTSMATVPALTCNGCSSGSVAILSPPIHSSACGVVEITSTSPTWDLIPARSDSRPARFCVIHGSVAFSSAAVRCSSAATHSPIAPSAAA